ncbi:G10 protein [Trichomonas vaginalis G3]|uniref:G10 protein n=1 Tax=Trichomonas vaginalis (strain ATCC PRA-98 / G3) TaxID=412133 RepID=A2EKN9_TRIV3|nr:BUD31-like protein [Trichomonas vaginalis G3]EAY06778.1 G10 protein [Trichomonas vaginalis G3]KAI5485861.1 BUD31-like protein [Trichomonas vaginalis G3]|eukprot:XP_001319001.1 G10 protein [Trichomonas vaginalis G3]
MDPRVRKRSSLKPPPGWDEISAEVMRLNEEMRAAETSTYQEENNKEKMWKVMRCNWKRSRIIYEMRYKSHTMSKELYEWIVRQGYADNNLIDYWRKPGYDRLCCVACAARNSDHGGTCICRVPRNKRQKDLKCFHCGCPGCCSGDFSDSDNEEEPKQETEPQKQEQEPTKQEQEPPKPENNQ